MHYMMTFAEIEADFASRIDPELAPPYWGAWNAYIGAMREAGIIVSGNGLQPPATATTVRMRNGERQIHDGPFADSKEQLAGYFIIDVPDLDAALEWAMRSPSTSTGATEVRPVMSPPGTPD